MEKLITLQRLQRFHDNMIPLIPTKTSDLRNDDKFITNMVSNLVNYYKKDLVYTKEEVESLLLDITRMSYDIVDELPTASKDTLGVIYLVLNSESTEENTIYDQYLTVETKISYMWKCIGTTKMGFDKFAKKDEVVSKDSIVYCTQEQYDAWEATGSIKDDVEYNIYENED